MIETDVLIIGSGAAGLTAALTLATTRKVAVLAGTSIVTPFRMIRSGS